MKTFAPHARGFSLVEVTLAIGVAAFCLVAVFGLLPVGLSSNIASTEQTAAAGVARALIADLRNTPKTYPPTDQVSPDFKITVPASSPAKHTIFFDESDQAIGAQDADAVLSANPRYRATLNFTPPNSAQKSATTVRLLVTWPATSDPKASATPTNYAGAYEVVVAIDRN